VNITKTNLLVDWGSAFNAAGLLISRNTVDKQAMK